MEDKDLDVSPGRQFSRLQAEYVCQDGKFELRGKRHKGLQYTQIYLFRLAYGKEYLRPLINERWPEFPVTNVLGLEEGKECVVVGTLYKEMRLKPRILDEYSKERSVVPLVNATSFTDPGDYLIIEDEGGRTRLVGEGFSVSFYVTGVVVAVCGHIGKDGEFLVKEILEPGLAPQSALPKHDHQENDKFVAIISGLKVGGSDTNPLQEQLLIDHLTGHLGGTEEQRLSAQIVRVIIAGDSIELQKGSLGGQPLSVKDQQKLSEPMRELDIVLTQLASAMPVDIMPGAQDPANFSLPQQPLHRCLFPGATAYSTFVRATNPHQFELDGVKFLGTSGQNIEDLDKFSEGYNRLDYLERTLNWRHICPTAPDTLACFPCSDRDPFVIGSSCPHVYFCGNQDVFSTRLMRGPAGQCVRLICIPRFAATGIAVLVNLRTLECHCLTLSTSLLAS